MGELFRLERAPQPLEFTGERFTGSVSGQIEIDHFHRYFIARDLCRGKDVLDIASGEGYGSALLAQVARRVIGVELDAKSVAHANSFYSRENLRFLQGDARRFPLCDASVDVVVSFETFEHFAEQNDFLREVKRVLRPGGVLVVSTPDRDVYSPAGQAVNPYHVRELTQDEFRASLGGTFSAVSVYTQRVFAGSVVVPALQHTSPGAVRSFERRDANFAEADYGLLRAPILIALASDRPFADQFAASLYIAKNDIDNNGSLPPGDAQSAVPVQLYPFGDRGYCEDASIRHRIPCGEWRSIVFELPRGAGNGQLRMDPADSPAVIEIRKIVVSDSASRDVLWAAVTPAALRDVTVSGSAVLLPDEDAYILVSYGTDPQLHLPGDERFVKPLRVEFDLRVDLTTCAIYGAIEIYLRAVSARLERFRSELMTSHTERMLTAAELKRVATERNEARRELLRAKDEIHSAQVRKLEEDRARRRLESEFDALKSQFQNTLSAERAAQSALELLEAKLTSLEVELAVEHQIRAGLEQSLSWRITKPARAVMRSLRAAFGR